MKKIIDRLKRVEGQLVHVRENISSDTKCPQVITQFLAAKGALDAAFEAYVKESLAACGSEAKNEELQALVKMLIKK